MFRLIHSRTEEIFMRKLVLAVASIALLSTPAMASGIERFPAPPGGPAPILKAVLVPAGSATLYVSGQLAAPIDPKTSMSATTTIEELGDTRTQTISALNKVRKILEANGFSMSDVITLQVYVVGDPKLGGKMDFKGMNDGFKQFFGTSENANTVARTTVQVAALVAPAYLVEVTATAAKAPSQ